MCITAHFIDKNWKLQKRILRFRAISPPYDAEKISDEIFMFLNQWKIDHKILSLTVDNATYNDAMISSLKARVSIRGMLAFGGSLFAKMLIYFKFSQITR